MDVLEEYIGICVSDLRGSLPELEGCERQFVRRIKDIITETRAENHADFETEEKKLVNLMKEDLKKIKWVNHLNEIGEIYDYSEEGLEYLARLIGHSSYYYSLVVKNASLNFPIDYFNQKLEKVYE